MPRCATAKQACPWSSLPAKNMVPVLRATGPPKARALGVRAVIAESYERIHRSNLIGMGVLPLEFQPGETRESLGLTGHEVFEIEGISSLAPKKLITVKAKLAGAPEKTFSAIARADTPEEVVYYRHGGILQYVLRQML